MIDWTRFKELPGATTTNFEKLCRGVINRHYGFLGNLNELKNQPGVEFHITLGERCDALGTKGETVGWQCKWFEYKQSGELTSDAKKQIKKSLDKTKTHLDKIDIWILWTHQTLSKNDQEWYFNHNKNYSFNLILWNQDDLDQHLSGAALDLRNSYLGELAITPEMLDAQFSKSLEPVRKRWLPGLHQMTDSENEIRKILGEYSSWNEFESIKRLLSELINELENANNSGDYDNWKSELENILNLCNQAVEGCSIHENFSSTFFLQILSRYQDLKSKLRVRKFLTQLRSRNSPLALVITNIVPILNDFFESLQSVESLYSRQFISVVSKAGGGKTQLSAQLASSSNHRNAGILILGKNLQKGMNLNQLSNSIIFYERQVDNFESLLSAVNSAGERSNSRLPIIFDGLNEAENPREWKSLFESILPVLTKYPNVVIVTTQRPSQIAHKNVDMFNLSNLNEEKKLEDNCTPDSAYQLNLKGFNESMTEKAVKAYFNFYKIKYTNSFVPMDFFSHPLNLKIFCEVENPLRENIKTISSFPTTIYSLFRKQNEYSCYNITSMSNISPRYVENDVLRSFFILGEILWKNNSRTIPESIFKEIFELPNTVEWDSNIINLLAQEGYIFREEDKFKYHLIPAYDRLGGFLVAEYLLTMHRNENQPTWLSEESFINKIFGNEESTHPLWEDIFYALIVLIPKTIRNEQFWKNVPQDYQKDVLSHSYLIDKEDLCSATVDAYKRELIESGITTDDIEGLLPHKYNKDHPFNSNFLSDILMIMPLSHRDLIWTEFLRQNHVEIIGSLEKRIEKWRLKIEDPLEDIHLYLNFYTWFLASTVIDLRDTASETLFLLGKREPKLFFQHTISFLSVNDPYILERLLAICYAISSTISDKEILIDFADKLYKSFFLESSKFSSTHLMTREYASCTLNTILFNYPNNKLNLDNSSFNTPFPSMSRRDWKQIDSELNSGPIRMDFENYTIGRLIEHRSNYDISNIDYKKAKANILWRIYDLGWSEEAFSNVDASIGANSLHISRTNRAKIERYGQKYSWIAYYELAGQLSDEGMLKYWGEERFSTDIDPFFPRKVSSKSFESHNLLTPDLESFEEWLQAPHLSLIEGITEIEVDDQAWVLIHGVLCEESEELNRGIYFRINKGLISKDDSKSILRHHTEKKPIIWPNHSTLHNIYSGEIYSEIQNFENHENKITIEVGETIETYIQPRVIINNEIFSEGRTVNRKVSNTEEFSISQLVLEYYWEFDSNLKESISQIVLSPEIVKKLNLTFDPSTFNYSSFDGQTAVMFLNEREGSYKNYSKLVYLRKDLYEYLVNSDTASIARYISGEKRLAKKINDTYSNSYKEFDSFEILK